MVEEDFEIVNEKGLHARASARFVETVERFDADAEVCKDDMTVPGDSIMGLMMLAAARGSTVTVRAEGAQAAELITALRALIASCFGEDS